MTNNLNEKQGEMIWKRQLEWQVGEYSKIGAIIGNGLCATTDYYQLLQIILLLALLAQQRRNRDENNHTANVELLFAARKRLSAIYREKIY